MTVIPFPTRPEEPCVPLTEADMGPEPDTEPMEHWVIWTAKCGIIRFSQQRDSVEIMAMIDMINSLAFYAGDDECNAFLLLALSSEDAVAQWVHSEPKSLMKPPTTD